MNNHQKQFRILAIALSARGFGFAVLEGEGTLVDWAIKSVEGDKNARCIEKVKELLTHYQPHVLMLEELSNRRSARIQTLSALIEKTAAQYKAKVRLLARDQVF